MKFVLRMPALLILASLCVCSCAKPEGSEPVAPDSALSGIDPDQKALPRDGVSEATQKPVTDTTLDGTGEVVAGGSVSTGGSETVPPTPTVNETMSDVPPPVSVPEVATERSSAPEAAPASEAASAGVAGVGHQKRFIKAWELNVRSQPNRFSKIVGNLKGGDEVHVTLRGGWAKLDDGQWIRSRWLVKTRPSKFVGGPDNGDDKPVKAKKKKARKKSKKYKN